MYSPSNTKEEHGRKTSGISSINAQFIFCGDEMRHSIYYCQDNIEIAFKTQSNIFIYNGPWKKKSRTIAFVTRILIIIRVSNSLSVSQRSRSHTNLWLYNYLISFPSITQYAVRKIEYSIRYKGTRLDFSMLLNRVNVLLIKKVCVCFKMQIQLSSNKWCVVHIHTSTLYCQLITMQNFKIFNFDRTIINSVVSFAKQTPNF